MATSASSTVATAGLAVPPILALVALNFFMADVRDDLGPFFAVIVQQEGWNPATIGTVMTVGGLIGVAATIPAGALVDASPYKRALMVAASVIIAVSCLVLLVDKGTVAVIATQVAIPIAGAVIPPAIAAISLGIVGQKGFPRQLGLNETANHAGNVAAATLAGIATWMVGLGGILALQVAMTVGAILAVLAIDPRAIDHVRARAAPAEGDAPSGLATIFKDRSLLLFAVTLGCFHLANAAMLPMVGLRLAAEGSGAQAGVWMSASIVTAQATMVPMALLAAWIAQRHGYRPIVLAALLALPVRGFLAAGIAEPWAILPVQMLDGVGAGLLGVATPGLVARLLDGTGRFNVGLGAVMTVQGIGAALSSAFALGIVQLAGYGAAFTALAAIAVVAVPVFLMVRTPAPAGP